MNKKNLFVAFTLFVVVSGSFAAYANAQVSLSDFCAAITSNIRLG